MANLTPEQAANRIPNGTKDAHVFKSTLPHVQYILKNGKVCPFINGRYLTNVPAEIAELQAEVDANHPHIYVDDNEKTLDLSRNDALAGLRDRFMAEFMAMSPSERAGLQRINPDDPNGPLHTPSQAEMIATDPTVGNAGYTESDQKFRIKVASSSDAVGGANNPQLGNAPGIVNSNSATGRVPPNFIPVTPSPSPEAIKKSEGATPAIDPGSGKSVVNPTGTGNQNSTLADLRAKMNLNKSETEGNMPNSENKTSDGIAGT